MSTTRQPRRSQVRILTAADVASYARMVTRCEGMLSTTRQPSATGGCCLFSPPPVCCACQHRGCRAVTGPHRTRRAAVGCQCRLVLPLHDLFRGIPWFAICLQAGDAGRRAGGQPVFMHYLVSAEQFLFTHSLRRPGDARRRAGGQTLISSLHSNSWLFDALLLQAWRCRAACWWPRRSGAALGWPPLPPALCTACRCGCLASLSCPLAA